MGQKTLLYPTCRTRHRLLSLGFSPALHPAYRSCWRALPGQLLRQLSRRGCYPACPAWPTFPARRIC